MEIVKPYRVLLVDDHPVIRHGIRLLLAAKENLEVVGEASDGLQAIQQAGQLQPDVVIMDIEMPVLDGLQASEQLLTSGLQTHILILSGYDYAEFVETALRIGVDGFLLKEDAPDCLVDAICRIIAGEKGLVSEKLYPPKDKPGASVLQPCGKS